MDKATIRVGTNQHPGPILTCDVSFKTIQQQLDRQWATGHWCAVVEIPGFRFLVEKLKEDTVSKPSRNRCQE